MFELDSLEKRRLLSVSSIVNGKVVANANAGGDKIVIDMYGGRLDVKHGAETDVYSMTGLTGVIVNGGTGNDFLSISNLVTLPGTINAKGNNNKLLTGAGNDTINGANGTDTIIKGTGTTTVNGSTPTPTPVPTPTPAPTPSPTTSSPFIIGVWSQPISEFATWKARGINTLIWADVQNSVASWTAAADADGFYQIRQPNGTLSTDAKDPHLLAWAQNDEPDSHNTAASVLQAQYAAWKAAAPNMPVFTNFSGGEVDAGPSSGAEQIYAGYLKATNWVSTDTYPVDAHNNEALSNVGDALDRINAWSPGKRQIAIIEASNQQLSGETAAVTPGEMQAEAWDAIIHGATGIAYFPQQIGNGFKYDATTPAMQAAMTTLDANLTALGPVLMSAENPSGISLTLPSGLQGTWRQSGGKDYFIVQNLSGNTLNNQTIKLNGVASNAKATVDFENRSVTLSGNSVTENFAPYQTHVYVVG